MCLVHITCVAVSYRQTEGYLSGSHHVLKTLREAKGSYLVDIIS